MAIVTGKPNPMVENQYGDRILVLVDPKVNSNKRYDIVVNGDGTFTAYWGRISDGAGHPSQHKVYPMSKYDSTVRAKLRKGYRDVTAYNLATTTSGEDPIYRHCDAIVDKTVARMMRQLLMFADKKVAASYKVGAEAVTQVAIDDAKAILNLMRASCISVTDFNDAYVDLLSIIPRRIARVGDILAKDKGDFGRILTAETELLDVLEGQSKVIRAQRDSGTDPDADDRDILELLGIEMFVATEKQKDHVMRHLGDSLKPKVHEIYRVRNLVTEQRFDAWLESHGNPTVKEFWHGSRNENWMSILQNGLVLNPNAVRTGAMFGKGIYYAPSPAKSFRYTSYHGSYWAHGTSDTGLMGLYATAYGKPLIVDSNQGFTPRFGWEDLQRRKRGADCVHAKAGKALLNDEVIFYDEAQTTINYLVEFD